ncbi:transcriptional regulator [candidate division WOR-3 bacterium]|nr:transcriptional regulator [candidate division WOR-3 bacterium]
MSNKRRTRIEIMRDMLEVVSKGGKVNKTKIVYGANLNFERASRILDWLIGKGLVMEKSDRYAITEKGKEILREIYKLAALFK